MLLLVQAELGEQPVEGVRWWGQRRGVGVRAESQSGGIKRVWEKVWGGEGVPSGYRKNTRQGISGG